jgi:Fic family protein
MGRADRAGRYVEQPAGYQAFIPAPLPPVDLEISLELQARVSRADQAVGRLDGLTRTLPDADLFLAMYVRREALLSSQIEGTDCTLDDVLAYELEPNTTEVSVLDVEEVVNYVAAINYGLARLSELPLSLRLIREIHERLLSNTRGAEKTPGEFRTTQNWIGPHGASLAGATFVPPPPEEMRDAIGALEVFLHESPLPVLITCGLAHAQFETVHPFLDGNGRMGRLLITLLLCEREVLARPVLYLSYFLKRHRDDYFSRLMAIRDEGRWEEWLAFFVDGVAVTALEAASSAQSVHELRERHRGALQAAGGAASDLVLLDAMYSQPLVNSKWVAKRLGVAPKTAINLLDRLEGAGVLREVTGKARNRVYRYDDYMKLFDEPVDAASADETAS